MASKESFDQIKVIVHEAPSEYIYYVWQEVEYVNSSIRVIYIISENANMTFALDYYTLTSTYEEFVVVKKN